MTEKELRQSIVSAARDCGYLTYFTWTSLHSPKGMPDLILCRPPTLFFWELKSAKGTPSLAQLEWIEALKQVPGVDARIVRPADLEAAYQCLVSGVWPQEGKQ